MQSTDGDCLYDVRRFGAVGDGETPATCALQEAIDACHAAGGGTVLVPPGTYLTGTLYLKSFVTLHLSPGATLLGSSRREDYNADDVFPENPVFSRESVSGAHLIIAYEAEQVAITGRGTIDGNGAAFFEPLAPEQLSGDYRNKSCNFPIRDWRPGQMVFFCRCHDVAVQDVALLNSPYWTLFSLGCERVQYRGLRIENPPQTANGDGIDIDCCRYVTVSDCLIRTGDDCLTLRGHSRLLGEHAMPCEHVAVSNCVLSSPCTAVRVGVGDGIVRDCSLTNLVIPECRTGINFISAYSERAAHGTTIEDVHFSDVTMDAAVPLNLLLGRTAARPADIRHISFSNMRLCGRQGCYIGGNEGLPVGDIRLHNVLLRLSGDEVDPDFAHKTPLPYGNNGVADALSCRHVDGLRISNLEVVWEDVGESWRNGIALSDCEDVALTDVTAPAPPVPTAGEALRCENVTGLVVRG